MYFFHDLYVTHRFVCFTFLYTFNVDFKVVFTFYLRVIESDLDPWGPSGILNKLSDNANKINWF